jgi:hypothetical protein
MPVNSFKITVSQSQEQIKTIRLIALSGKNNFIRYITSPLISAGWKSERHPQGARKQIERITAESRSQSYYHTIAPKCKRLISGSMDESLAAVGDSCIFFLEMMQLHAVISSSPESLEFTGILKSGFSEFHAASSSKNETLFKEAVESAAADDIKKVVEPVDLDLASKKRKLDAEIQKLYNNLLIASKYNNLQKAKKLLSAYIITFCDHDDYSRQDVELLIDAMNKRYEDFNDDLKSMISIDLYYKISRSIISGDIAAAVQGIRKFAYIFEGDPAAKYYQEIDRLERILYPIITEKNLWNTLKK